MSSHVQLHKEIDFNLTNKDLHYLITYAGVNPCIKLVRSTGVKWVAVVKLMGNLKNSENV